MDVRVNARFLGFWKVEGELKSRDLCFTDVICLVFVFRDNFPALAEKQKLFFSAQSCHFLRYLYFTPVFPFSREGSS